MADKRLIRFLIGHAIVGMACGVGFVALLLGMNVNGLRDLVLASDVGFLAALIMAVFFAITFGSVQTGIALMLRGPTPDDPPPGRLSGNPRKAAPAKRPDDGAARAAGPDRSGFRRPDGLSCLSQSRLRAACQPRCGATSPWTASEAPAGSPTCWAPGEPRRKGVTVQTSPASACNGVGV